MASATKSRVTASRPGASRVQVWVVAGVLALLVAGGYFFFARTRDVQRSPPCLIGNVWTASVGGAARVYFVTREDRAVARAYDTEGAYTYEHRYSLYMLHARAAADGSPIAAVQIARIDTTTPDLKNYQAYQTLPDGPGILGPQTDVLWLWNNGPEARNLQSLEPVWTTDALKSRNPQAAPLLPEDPKYAKVIGPLDAMVFKGRDAAYYRIDRTTGEILPVDEPALASLSREHTKTADTAFSSLGPGGKSLRSVSVSGLIVNAVLDDGSWFALLTANQRSTLSPRLGFMEEWNLRMGSVDETAASFFGGRYALEREQNLPRTSIKLDLASVAPIGTARFLMAGFLRRPGTTGAWTLEPPSARSYIVLHRQAIGDKSPWSLTRAGTDGATHWTRDTGLTELNHVCDGGTSIVITGFTPDSRPKGHWPERMIFVDAATGAMTMLNTASGELATAN